MPSIRTKHHALLHIKKSILASIFAVVVAVNFEKHFFLFVARTPKNGDIMIQQSTDLFYLQKWQQIKARSFERTISGEKIWASLLTGRKVLVKRFSVKNCFCFN
jgi:hypothetical protein